MKTVSYLKLMAGALLLYSALAQLFSHQTWWFIQNVNLIFHEAGHIFLMFFGHTIHLLGGSLFEISIPLLITLYFFANRQFFSAAFGAWWLSTALHSVSIYVADAREQALPLLGGNAVTHDWHALLSGWSLLNYDAVLGYVLWVAALCSALFITYFLYRDKDVTLLVQRYFNHHPAHTHETHFTQH